MAQVDIAKVDRDLLTICGFKPKFLHIVHHVYHPYAIPVDGKWKVRQASSRPVPDLWLNPIRFFTSMSQGRHPERERGPQREI